MKKRVKVLVHDRPGKGRRKFKCAQCKVIKYKIKSRFKLGRARYEFCGMNCKNIAQRIGGILAPKHSGSSKHYRAKALRLLPHVCARCGYKKRKDILQVHHKDENRLNDDIKNLEILCPNCHMVHHHDQRKKK
jgi:5-methylcytosine-specific restriction endonuclease McrA